MNESVAQLKLDKNALYKELHQRCQSDSSLCPILTLIQKVGDYSISISKSIIMNMRELVSMMKIIFLICYTLQVNLYQRIH